MNISTTENTNLILGRYIRNKLGLQIISPGDCKRISFSIEKDTGKLISETTLKRFFGFARQPYNFSQYTLNVICEYAGFESWEQFNQIALTGNGEYPVNEDFTWENLRSRSMTKMTLSSIRNNSGIPFSATVSRVATEADFDYFMRSDYRLFCLTGPAAIGKSIQVAHLVNKFFADKDAPYRKDIVWLQKADKYEEGHSFFIKELKGKRYNIEKLLEVLDYLDSHPEEIKGKLVFIFDGYDNHVFDLQTLDRFFSYITDLLSYGREFLWLKIVISLRAASWLLLQTKIDQSDYLRTIWFSGFFYRKELTCNLFPLSPHEADAVMQNICSELNINKNGLLLNENVYNLLGHPAYIQLYFNLLKRNKGRSLRGNALYCELVISFVAHKIQQANHALEKMWLIKKILKANDYARAGGPINRNIMFEPDEILIRAYNELVNDGIFQEEYKEDPLKYQVTVALMEPVLYYFVATELVEQNQDISPEKLAQLVQKDYPSEKGKLIILWIMINGLIKQKGALLPIIFHKQLPASVRSQNIFFICDLLEDDVQFLADEERKKFIKKCIHLLASSLFITDWTNGIGARLNVLLDFTSCEKEKGNLVLMLAYTAILKLDHMQLARCIILLRKLDKKTLKEYYPLNPVDLLEFMECYYSSKPVDQEFLNDIEVFLDNPPAPLNHQPDEPGTMLSYSVAVLIMTLCGKYRQAIALSDIMCGFYKNKSNDSDRQGIPDWISLWKAAALAGDKKLSEAENIMRQLSQQDKISVSGKGQSLFTFMYRILKGNLYLSRSQYDKAIKLLNKVDKEVRVTDCKLLHLFTAISLIRGYNKQKDFEKAANTIKEAQQMMAGYSPAIEKLAYVFINRV